MFLIFGGHLDTPICLYALIHLYVCTSPWGANIPICPPYCSMHLYVLGVCRGPLTHGTTPLHAAHLPHGRFLPICLTPQLIGLLPCASICLGISACYMGNIPLLGVEEVFPHMLRVWGIYTSVKLWCLEVCPLGVHYALPCTFFVVHYVSHIYHSYYYYSWLWWCLLVCHLFHQ